MYKVLYRKWRPKTFDEVIGQDHITNILKNQILHKKISHALMFCGVRGTGKTSCAKIFAKGVNCLHNINGNPCLECEMCKKIEESSTLDVMEIDAASNNSVENIRLIREESNLATCNASYKVYIIDEFHMLSSGAFNAFLRTLEEPAKNVIFILATTEYHKVPKTIISRCQRFDFHMVDERCIYSRLKFISERENFSIDDDALHLIAKNSDGSVRDSLSILDQCVNCVNSNISADDVKNSLGLSDSIRIKGIISNILSGNLENALNIVNNLYEKGKNMTYICEMMMSLFHDLFCYKSSNILMNSSAFNEGEIEKISSPLPLTFFLRSFDILKKSYVQLKDSPNAKYEIDEGIIKIYNELNTNNRIDKKIEKSNGTESILREKTTENDDKSSNNLEKLECWDDIIDSIGSKVSNSLSFLLKGTSAYISNDSIMIDTNDFVYNMIQKSYDEIENIIFEGTNKNYKIRKIDKKNSVCNENVADIKYLEDKAKSNGIDFDINL